MDDAQQFWNIRFDVHYWLTYKFLWLISIGSKAHRGELTPALSTKQPMPIKMFCNNLVSLNNNQSNIRNNDMIVTYIYKLVGNNFNMNSAILQLYNEQFSQI